MGYPSLTLEWEERAKRLIHNHSQDGFQFFSDRTRANAGDTNALDAKAISATADTLLFIP
jgi:hypothetical protein